MNTNTRNYYERELDRIGFAPTAKGYCPASVLFGSDGKTTKALAVNAECAAAIIAKLVELFVFPAAAPIPAPIAVVSKRPYSKRPYVNYKMGKDANGNRVIRVRITEGTWAGRGFSIQTCGNLPITHRAGVVEATDDEVRAYIVKHGTPRQKRILGI